MPRKGTGGRPGRPRKNKLSPNQVRAVEEEAKLIKFNESTDYAAKKGRNKAIASTVGISRSILYRWQKLPDYQAALENEIIRRWVELLTKAVDRNEAKIEAEWQRRVEAQAEFILRQTSRVIRQPDGSKKIGITDFDLSKWQFPRPFPRGGKSS